MPRSSSDHLLFRDPDPTQRPFIVARLPSQRDGRVVDVSLGFTPDGQMKGTSTDRGRIRDNDDPFFYLSIFGGTLAMTKNDMHECIEEMVYTRQQKAKRDPRVYATAQGLKQKVADLRDAVADARAGRKRFAMGGK